MAISLRVSVVLLAATLLGPVLTCAALWCGFDRESADQVAKLRDKAGIPPSRVSLYDKQELAPAGNGAVALGVASLTRDVPKIDLPPLPVTRPHVASLQLLLSAHRDLLTDAEIASSHPHFAVSPRSRLYERSSVIIRRLDLAGSLLARRAENAVLDGRQAEALTDLATLRDVCNRLNRIPTVSTGIIRERMTGLWLTAAADCAPCLDAGNLRRLREMVSTLEPSDRERVLTGEASKELEAATGRDLVNLTDSRRYPSFWPYRLNALGNRYRWSPTLAAAWSQALTAYRTNPQALAAISAPLTRFSAQFPHSVEMLTWSDEPGRVATWLQSATQNSARREMLGLALEVIQTDRAPTAEESVDPFADGPFRVMRQPKGWCLVSNGMDGLDDAGLTAVNSPRQDLLLEWDGKQLEFRGS